MPRCWRAEADGCKDYFGKGRLSRRPLSFWLRQAQVGKGMEPAKTIDRPGSLPVSIEGHFSMQIAEGGSVAMAKSETANQEPPDRSRIRRAACLFVGVGGE